MPPEPLPKRVQPIEPSDRPSKATGRHMNRHYFRPEDQGRKRVARRDRRHTLAAEMRAWERASDELWAQIGY